MQKPIDLFYFNVFRLGVLCASSVSSQNALEFVVPTGNAELDEIFDQCQAAFAIGDFSAVFEQKSKLIDAFPELIIFYAYLDLALTMFTGSFSAFDQPAILYTITNKQANGFPITADITEFVNKQIMFFMPDSEIRAYFSSLHTAFTPDETSGGDTIEKEKLFITPYQLETNLQKRAQQIDRDAGVEFSKFLSHELGWYVGNNSDGNS